MITILLRVLIQIGLVILALITLYLIRPHYHNPYVKASYQTKQSLEMLKDSQNGFDIEYLENSDHVAHIEAKEEFITQRITVHLSTVARRLIGGIIIILFALYIITRCIHRKI